MSIGTTCTCTCTNVLPQSHTCTCTCPTVMQCQEIWNVNHDFVCNPHCTFIYGIQLLYMYMAIVPPPPPSPLSQGLSMYLHDFVLESIWGGWQWPCTVIAVLQQPHIHRSSTGCSVSLYGCHSDYGLHSVIVLCCCNFSPGKMLSIAVCANIKSTTDYINSLIRMYY